MGLFFENKRKSGQSIREQVGQKKTRDPVDKSKRAIKEQFIGERVIGERVIGKRLIGGKSDQRMSIVERAVGEM